MTRFLIASFVLFLCARPAHAQWFGRPPGQLTAEEDGTPDLRCLKYKFTNGTVTDNGDGTCSISIAGSTAYDDIGDPDANSTIAFAGYTNTWTSTLDNGTVFKIDNTDADLTNDTFLLDLEFTDDSDVNGVFLRCLDNNGDTMFKIGKDGQMTIGPAATNYVMPTADGSANDFLATNGAGAVSFTSPDAGTDLTADLEEETHASEHIDDGTDPIDGDKLEISATWDNITPDHSGAESDSDDDLAAILEGIDDALGAAGGATAWDDISDPDNNGTTTITFDNAAENTVFSNVFDNGTFFKIDNTVADLGNDTVLLELEYTDDGDANGIFFKANDANGTRKVQIGNEGVTLIGETANTTNFGATQLIASHSDGGQTNAHNTGVVGEAAADGSLEGRGVWGCGKTNGARRGVGVYGRAYINNGSDSADAVGGAFYSTTNHTNADNIGVYSSALNASGTGTNYSFYGDDGEFHNDGDASIGGTLTITAGSLADDTIQDPDIDWGTGANQVSGADVPLTDEFGFSANTNVQDVMDDLDEAIPDYYNITIDPTACILDDSSPPAITVKESTGTGTPRYRVAAFDAATDEIVYCGFTMPDDYNAGGTTYLDVYWHTNDTGADEDAIWAAALSCTSEGDAADMEEQAVDTANTAAENCNATEADRLIVTPITMTNTDSAAAGDECIIRFYRDADDSEGNADNDGLSSDAEVTKLRLRLPRT